jgi:hypothetical protein
VPNEIETNREETQMSASKTTAGPSRTASERITDEVGAWPGVEAGWGRRGEFAFRVGRHEIGHLHGDHAAHFFFPKELWAQLREQGRITSHPVFPDREGPAARAIRGEDDIQDVIALMRLGYDRIAVGGDKR